MANVFGIPTDEQLAKINKLAKRKLSADEVFVFPSKLAGDMIIPDRNVQLTKELLDVFAVDANKGVAFLLDHSWHADGLFGMGGRPRAAIPYGRSFNSSFGLPTEDGETVSLNADTYMKRDVTIDGVNTNDLIQSIESGTLFDTSIGFNYNKALCSICNKNIYRSDECEHEPGKTYEVEGDDKVVRNLFCYAKAYPPGGLWENSGVFDGAYPGAGMLSRNGDILENESGIYQVITDLKGMDPSKPVIATYSDRLGLLTMVKKSENKKPFALGALVDKAQSMMTDQESIFALGNRIGVSKDQVINIANLVLKGGEKTNMNEEKFKKMCEAFDVTFDKTVTSTDEVLSQLVEKWDAATLAVHENAEPLHLFMTEDQVAEKLGKELSSDEVLKLAKEGQEYHQEVIENAITMGVRAQGNDFPVETWRNAFTTMSTASIKDITSTFEAQAKAVIPAGRGTSPEAGVEGFNKSQQIPDEAYKVK